MAVSPRIIEGVVVETRSKISAHGKLSVEKAQVNHAAKVEKLLKEDSAAEIKYRVSNDMKEEASEDVYVVAQGVKGSKAKGGAES